MLKKNQKAHIPWNETVAKQNTVLEAIDPGRSKYSVDFRHRFTVINKNDTPVPKILSLHVTVNM